MANQQLSVLLYGEPVGLMTTRGHATSFEFLDAYLDQPSRPVLGQQFVEAPRQRWTQAHRLPRWFANLLPEDGPLLRFLASELKLNPRVEPGLLAALGHDLPGALTITSPETSQATSHRRLEQPVEGRGAAEQLTPNVRFSVAGVQLKLSMTHDAGGLRLAGKGGLGNSYVKFPGHYSHIPENEFTMMRLAKAAGITVPKVQLLDGEELGIVPGIFERHRSSKLFVIERFDRTTSGPIQIEDLNQVIDNWPDQKHGGASYEALGRLILNICGEPDFLEYIRRLTFAWLAMLAPAKSRSASVLHRC